MIVSSSTIGVSGGNVNAFGGEAAVDSSGTGTATANDNEFKMTGTGLYGHAAGGSAWSRGAAATASGNEVVIEGGDITLADPISSAQDFVVGGESVVSSADGRAIADNNHVSVANTGLAVSPSASVEFASVAGGHGESLGDAQANDNTVFIGGITATGKDLGLFGGFARSSASGDASANDNQITVALVDDAIVSGGFADVSVGNARADDNVVTGSSLTAYVISGGHAFVNDGSGTASASGNRISLNDADVSSGYVAGGFAGALGGEAAANGNSVSLTDGIAEVVFGGHAEVYSSGSFGLAEASSNRVFLKDVGATEVNGGHVTSRDGDAFANNNTVVVVGGDAGTVRGGFVGLMNVYNLAEASGNSVVLTDAVANDVFGGHVCSFNGFVCSGAVPISGTRAVRNTVTLAGSAEVGGSLFGGFGEGATGDFFTGNTLVVRTPDQDGINVNHVYNFEFYEFVFDGGRLADAVGLNVASGGVLRLGDGGPDSKSKITRIDVVNGGPLLSAGQELTLISVESGGTVIGEIDLAGSGGFHDAVVQYDYQLKRVGDEFVATVTSVQASEASKSISEGFLGGTGVLIQAADHAGGATIETAVESVDQAGRGATILGPVMAGFGTVSGGSLKHKTGSHVDAGGFNLSAGAAFGRDLGIGRLVLGAFVEYGKGSYDTFNDFPSFGTVIGHGDTSYLGGGLMARLEFGSGAYLEASGRFGKIENDYTSPDLVPGSKRVVSYESKTPYAGLHFGVGHKFRLTDVDLMDVYGKFFWSHQNSDSLPLSNGAAVVFEDVDSYRLRVGGRYTRSLGARVGLFAGAAYEREFDGKASATTYGLPIEAPKLDGNTGIGELGVSLKPTPNSPFTFELAAQGYVGKRQGVTGSLNVRLEF